ncbi:hypothetical protein ACIGEZ_27690 [Streptomyces sp. NPDC085481]|uniref:hypothetical protein n=1 Tax=Streptomyces sp. NPDC085481 TaxID=3365727 RepID=UPI0037D606A3
MSSTPVIPVPPLTERPPGAATRRRPGALAAGLLLLAVATLPALVVRPDPANPPFQDLDDRLLDAGAGAGLVAWWLCAPALARESARDRRGAGAPAPTPAVP